MRDFSSFRNDIFQDIDILPFMLIFEIFLEKNVQVAKELYMLFSVNYCFRCCSSTRTAKLPTDTKNRENLVYQWNQWTYGL